MGESKSWFELHHEDKEKRLLEKRKLELEQQWKDYGYKPEVASKIVGFYVSD